LETTIAEMDSKINQKEQRRTNIKNKLQIEEFLVVHKKDLDKAYQICKHMFEKSYNSRSTEGVGPLSLKVETTKSKHIQMHYFSQYKLIFSIFTRIVLFVLNLW
jgi:hypothetical protein